MEGPNGQRRLMHTIMDVQSQPSLTPPLVIMSGLLVSG